MLPAVCSVLTSWATTRQFTEENKLRRLSSAKINGDNVIIEPVSDFLK